MDRGAEVQLGRRALAIHQLVPSDFLAPPITVNDLNPATRVRGAQSERAERSVMPALEAWAASRYESVPMMFSDDHVPKAEVFRWLSRHHEQIELVVLWTPHDGELGTERFVPLVEHYVRSMYSGKFSGVYSLQVDSQDPLRVRTELNSLVTDIARNRDDASSGWGDLPWRFVYQLGPAGERTVAQAVREFINLRFDSRVSANFLSSNYGLPATIGPLTTSAGLERAELLVSALVLDYPRLAQHLLDRPLGELLEEHGGRDGLIAHCREELGG